MFRVGFGLVLACFLTIVSSSFGEDGNNIYFAKYLEYQDGKRELVFQGWVPGTPSMLQDAVREQSYPQAIVEHQPLGPTKVVELSSDNAVQVKELLTDRNVLPIPPSNEDSEIMDEEVITLVGGGPPSNRIDLVFMGDGYTEGEREKFFADAKRLTDDMFRGNTFNSYLPVFNVHAVFRPSQESGIGKNSTPKNTAYGLYREGNTLRAIYASKQQTARESCRKAPDCDYPILMANDPHYGGLGGEFAITTSSPTSGTKVLRHELGHNFGRVGEEYDGGGYFGANYSYSVSSVKWPLWLSERLRAQPATALFIKWPWHHLKLGAYDARFRSSGNYGYYEVQYSASGIETEDTLEILIDGIAIHSPGPGRKDREFHEYFHEGGFSSGNHVVTAREKIHDGDNWLSDLTVYEYGEDYNFDPENIGAYPLHSAAGQIAGYRATHETCLMRNMKSTTFCPICQENNWLKFFGEISLIDTVDVKVEGATVKVEARVPELGQFRKGTRVAGELLEVRWSQNGQEVPELSGKLSWEMPKSQASGRWKVWVQFVTPEIRKDASSIVATKSLSI